MGQESFIKRGSYIPRMWIWYRMLVCRDYFTLWLIPMVAIVIFVECWNCLLSFEYKKLDWFNPPWIRYQVWTFQMTMSVLALLTTTVTLMQPVQTLQAVSHVLAMRGIVEMVSHVQVRSYSLSREWGWYMSINESIYCFT